MLAEWLVVYGATVEEWTRKYGVEPFSSTCFECGRTKTTTIPFVSGQMRGLAAPPCPCGSTDGTYGYVRDPKYGDMLGSTSPLCNPRKKLTKKQLKAAPSARVIPFRRPVA